MGPTSLAVAFGVAVMLAAPPDAPGNDQGVAIDVGRIDVEEDLTPGRRYELPTVRVRNPGTAASDYRMVVQPISGTRGPDATWITFSPDEFSLDPDERRPVQVTLTLPADADAGQYEALLTAQVAPTGDGARIGAGAAARLRFTVDASTAIVAPSTELPATASASGRSWWIVVAGLAVGVAVLGWRRARRYNIRIERRT
jgi:hypothetical protein